MERASLQRQIEQLEQRVQQLQDRLDERFTLAARQQVWLGQTASEVISGSGNTEEREYPSAASTTVGVKFRRPKFMERIGAQELEGPFGSDGPYRYAMTVPQQHHAEGTDVFLVEIDRQFYILPTGKSVYIVQLDEDLPEAKRTDAGSTSTSAEKTCVNAPSAGATVWAFDERGILCPTEQRVEPPDGVFNFQTDKRHRRWKSGGEGSGDPNLLLIYREAATNHWVPECSTCDTATVVEGLDCDCVADEALCRVLIHFRLVDAIEQDDEIDGATWPTYCNWIVVPGSGFLGLCGSSCHTWNRIDGWEVVPELGPPGTGPDACSFGMFQRGAARTPGGNFQTAENFPCSSQVNADVTGIKVQLLCPDPTDGTGTASAEVWIHECLVFIAWFDDVEYLPNWPLNGEPTGQMTENRVTRISVVGHDIANPFDPQDRCHCIVETTRNDLAQGNFNASTSTPNLQHGAPGGLNVAGHSYVVNVAGTHDFGDGGVSLEVNDTVVYDDLLWKWVVIPKKAGGAVDNETFAPVEFIRFIDSDGCDWSRTFNNAMIALQFLECP